MPGSSPWADPTTETQPGAPYQGPPPTAPQYGYPAPYGYGYPGPAPYPGYGYPGPWAPRRPQRPGQVITSAVLAFVQTALVLVASLYLWFFTSMIGFAIALRSAGQPQLRPRRPMRLPASAFT